MATRIISTIPGQMKAQINGTRVSSDNKRGKKQYLHVATTDKQYTKEELEYVNAMRDYILASGHKFPTFSEHLNVLKSLGYSKIIICPACKEKQSAI